MTIFAHDMRNRKINSNYTTVTVIRWRHDDATAVELLFNLSFINSGFLASSSFSFTSYNNEKHKNVLNINSALQ